MKNIKTLMIFLCVALIVLGMVSSAVALPIIPSTGVLNISRWEGITPVNPNAGDIPGIVGYNGTLNELYKQDVSAVSDTGPYAGSYGTTFANTPTDPMDATIAWVMNTPFIGGPPIYLLVKNGNEVPRWYIFDLSALWDGKETINMTGFWPNQGSISHVALYGDSTGIALSEPITLLLLGFGLVGLAGVRRFKK